jgi:hypothetical protein
MLHSSKAAQHKSEGRGIAAKHQNKAALQQSSFLASRPYA